MAAGRAGIRVGMLAPIAWSTPPEHYGPWEQVASTLTEALIDLGVSVTLYATGDSRSRAPIVSVVEHGYEVDPGYDVKVYEALHIARCFEDAAAGELDLIHNHFDFLPLAWTRLVPTPTVTTIHGFSSENILPAYRRYDGHVHYVSISAADRHPDLTYAATIHHGIDLRGFEYRESPEPDGHLLAFGRIHPDKGTDLAIEIAQRAGRPLRIAGIVQDQTFFDDCIRPKLGTDVEFLGPLGGRDRVEALGAATALLHPIRFAEPFGLSVIEANACGTPVIAFERGALPELIRHGVNGYLVADVVGAAGAAAQVEQLSRAKCRTEAHTRFSAERMARDYLRLYRRLLPTA